MGEYADIYFREEIKKNYGFDPGSMYEDDNQKKKKHNTKKIQCEKCKKWFIGLKDHMRDVHKI